jgi:hypothetical protein
MNKTALGVERPDNEYCPEDCHYLDQTRRLHPGCYKYEVTIP